MSAKIHGGHEPAAVRVRLRLLRLAPWLSARDATERAARRGAGRDEEYVFRLLTLGASMTWLSVIIPCRNGERFLSDALQSLANQRDHGIEIIFVDGSTNDESLKLIQKFSNRLNILSFSRPELNSWMAKSNFGVERARSEYVCILHVGDMWLHE